MPLTPGTKLGSYEVLAPLGAGGMGEVYRAHDAKLGRDVAVKLLPEAFAQDPERLARFEREARLLASLRHANIAVLHGLEEDGGRRFLVMECVEGESLAERLARGALSVAEALPLARDIAAALEAAHEGGVVHRDLKPGNVMVTPDGGVKVLDFGLAKGSASGGSDPDMSASPTMTYAGTQAGVILGTAAYMSPEQARGKSVDRRTDIWSFGCLLFECLTGRKAFAGETISDIVACILQVEPAWTALPADTPERVRALLRRCLEKDAKRRLRDIGEARIEIEDLLAAQRSGAGAAPAAAPARRAAPPWGALAVTAVVAALATWFGARPLAPAKPATVTRFEVAAPRGGTIPPDAFAQAISPDGRAIAIGGTDSAGTPGIWVRALDVLEPRRLPGTGAATMMFWSPDSRQLAFCDAERRLMRVAIDGGEPEVICETRSLRGGSWSPNGTILIAPYSNGGIYRVPATGGTPVAVTHPDSTRGEVGHRFPVWLPDGRHFLYASLPPGPDGRGAIMLASVDGGAPREVLRAESGILFAPPGWLLTTRRGALVAYRFDVRRLRVVGEPVRIGDIATETQYAGGAFFTVSAEGSLAFLTRRDTPRRLRWYDLEARPLDAPPVPAGPYTVVRISPDRRHALLLASTEPSRNSLVVADLERGVTTTLSSPEENPQSNGWSNDGTHVVYDDGVSQTVRVRSLVDGSLRTFLTGDRVFKTIAGFLPGDSVVVYGRLDRETKWDLWRLPLATGTPTPLLTSPANENNASLSGDGRYISYMSDPSAVNEVWVSPLATPAARFQVTVGGAAGGFVGPGQQLVWLPAAEPRTLYGAEGRPGTPFAIGPQRRIATVPTDFPAWDITPDLGRVLALEPAERPRPQTLTVLQGWPAALRPR